MHKIHHLHTGSAVSILEKVGPTVHLSKEANEYNHISPERRGSKLGAMVYNSSSSWVECTNLVLFLMFHTLAREMLHTLL
jgi:hypothetical protein